MFRDKHYRIIFCLILIEIVACSDSFDSADRLMIGSDNADPELDVETESLNANKFDGKFSCGTGANYIDQLRATAKWDLSRFPVSLFVNKASLPEVDEKVLYGVVNNVFLDWSKVGGGIASYRIIEEC